MGSRFEFEKRALLKPMQVREIKSLLNKRAVRKENFKRFSIVFWDHPELEPKTTSPYDFRIRITKKMGLFTLKHGDWRGGGREEYEFHFDTTELSSILNLMRVLGYKWGTTTYVERTNYRYKEMEVTLDKYLDDGKGILEIEALTKSKKDFIKAEERIDKIFSEWGITPLNKDGFVKFVQYINNKRDNFFDLSKGSVEKYIRLWKNKFK